VPGCLKNRFTVSQRTLRPIPYSAVLDEPVRSKHRENRAAQVGNMRANGVRSLGRMRRVEMVTVRSRVDPV
jgi:hypothetical protein